MKFFSALLTCLLALSIPALAADPEAAPWKEFHFDDKEAGLSAVVLHRQSTNEWKLQLLSESAKPQPMTLAVRKVIDGDGVLYRIFFWVPGAALECIPSCRAQFTFDDDEPVVLGLTKGEEDGPAVYYVDQVAAFLHRLSSARRLVIEAAFDSAFVADYHFDIAPFTRTTR